MVDAGTIAGAGCVACSAVCCLVGCHVLRLMNREAARMDEPSPTIIPNVASTENLAGMCKSGSCQNLVMEELPSEEQ
jgi:hypothetical protein